WNNWSGFGPKKVSCASPRERPVGLFPGVDAAFDVAGAPEAGVLRSLYGHGRAFAKCTVEDDPLTGRCRQFVQHSAGADVLLQVRIGRVQGARNSAMALALAFF